MYFPKSQVKIENLIFVSPNVPSYSFMDSSNAVELSMLTVDTGDYSKLFIFWCAVNPSSSFQDQLVVPITFRIRCFPPIVAT